MLEYLTVPLVGATPASNLAGILNDYTSQGWNLVTIIERTVVFSRDVVREREGAERPHLRR